MERTSERSRLLLAVLFLLACIALAVGGVGFAVGAQKLADAGESAERIGDLLDPPTRIGPDRAAVVTSVRELARLETAVLEIEQRIVGQRGTEGSWYWLGERMVFVARGEVTAGIDLAELGDDDVRVGPDGAVYVALPAARIWRVDLNEDASYVEGRERGWFGTHDPQLESRARRQAVDLLRATAVERGITATATRAAQDAVRTLLEQTGATAVHFDRTAPTPVVEPQHPPG